MPIDPPTACIVFDCNHSDDVFYGRGFGAVGEAAGELCFNTSMTGYQEIMTDPSYAGQIVAFTFPHIGNVGANSEDEEAGEPVALGMVTREDPTAPSNWRAGESLDAWLKAQGRIGVGGIDTRRLTRRIREAGAPHVAVAYDPEGRFDIDALRAKARAFPGLEGMDLAQEVSTRQSYEWAASSWRWDGAAPPSDGRKRRVVAIDYGAKRNILRRLVDVGCEVTVMPAGSSAESVLAREPDGVFLSNGPGDPAATGVYAVPVLQELIARDLPIFGVCLGHQLLALALGANTRKMAFGHHGANHPVKELDTGKVEITSMNHGFAVDAETLPAGVVETHVSLFDGTNCGIRVADKPIFSVQHHPEASPGPQDSGYLFERFAANIDARAD